MGFLLPISLIGCSFILFLIFVFLKFKKYFLQIAGIEKVVLLVKVPKETWGQEIGDKIKTIDGIREIIGSMESFYSNLYGLRKSRFIEKIFKTSAETLSLEIVNFNRLIKFYIAVSKTNQEYVEEQIHAQFPNAEIEEVEDYNIFKQQSSVLGSYLILKKQKFLPIRTYKEIPTDPLNAITNALSKLNELQGAAIQIIIKPAPSNWAKKGLKVASLMQQGKSFKKALHSVGSSLIPSPTNIIYEGMRVTHEMITGSSKKEFPETSKKEEFYKLSPLEEEIVKGIESKSAKFAFEVNLRIIVSAENLYLAKGILNNITNSFAQFDCGGKGNGFKLVKSKPKVIVRKFIYRNFDKKRKLILNTEELASIWHLPLPSTETPNILWLTAKKSKAPENIPEQGIILGVNIYRGEEKIIRIKRNDRRRHIYIIGRSGTGKSVLLANMAIQDIKNGDGVGVIDPHGDLVERILAHIPKQRVDDVVYFDPSDTDYPIGLNMLEAKTDQERDFAVQEMIAIFHKLFPPEVIGPMFEHNMRNAMLTLMSDPEDPGTLVEIPRIFTDREYQRYKATKVKDPVVRNFWEKEMAQTTDFHKSEMLGYLISKVGRFVENEMMRNIIGQAKSKLDFRKIMDNQKILLVNLSKGKIGEINCSLLGLILVGKLQMAALSRADIKEEQRKDFFLYIDEFQSFVTDSIATILSEARKYKLDLTLAHQYLGQLILPGGDRKVLEAILGNVGTLIAFRVGVEDAETIAKEFAPVFNEYDVINIEKFNAYVKLLVDNKALRPFSMKTYPLEQGDIELALHIKELSRRKYGRPKIEIEKEILKRSKLGISARKADFTNIEPSL